MLLKNEFINCIGIIISIIVACRWTGLTQRCIFATYQKLSNNPTLTFTPSYRKRLLQNIKIVVGCLCVCLIVKSIYRYIINITMLVIMSLEKLLVDFMSAYYFLTLVMPILTLLINVSNDHFSNTIKST